MEKFVNLSELFAHCVSFLEVFNRVDHELLEYHNDGQVDGERGEVLVVDDGDKVTNVGIDEGEHVGLVDG